MANIFIDLTPNLPTGQQTSVVASNGTFGTVNTGLLLTSDGTVSAPSHSFLADTNTGIYRAGNDDFGLTAGGLDRIRMATSGVTILGTFAATSGVALRGTVTNDNAPTGYIGEYASSSVLYRGSSGTAGVYSDMIALTLSPGDWDITGMASATLNGATITAWETAISSTSGNSQTGFVEGDNYISAAPPTATSNTAQTIANWRRSISAQTTFYHKSAFTFAAGQGKYQARISARRIR